MPLAQLFGAGVRLLFFKAQRRGDDRTAELFPVEVPVQGHIRQDGTYVVPHRAIRYKKRPERAEREQAAVADLFGDMEAPAPKHPPATAFTPTHELPDGTKVVAHVDETNVWVDVNGTEYEGNNAYPLELPKRVAANEPCATR